jgi:hypothetical protein
VILSAGGAALIPTGTVTQEDLVAQIAAAHDVIHGAGASESKLARRSWQYR